HPQLHVTMTFPIARPVQRGEVGRTSVPSVGPGGPPVSLRHGRPMVAIPGPSVVPDRVLSAMHRAMPNIYEGELIELSLSVLEDLAGLVRTSGTAFVAVSNGHGAWEMAITNTLSRGDKVLVLESGRFAVAWGEMAAVSGVDVTVLQGPRRGPV